MANLFRNSMLSSESPSRLWKGALQLQQK
ncbi:hypothetical protein CCACVL1_09821 [Corchorus capsularis]|uniref:Uncharacterized protein n=1 Tax=Corchorus capsularis TaxID=210143 RepID=A0A1R3IU06_COCAP|nr:hypothetical protein CCACVL1_09821 [Corchorus capsularis]